MSIILEKLNEFIPQLTGMFLWYVIGNSLYYYNNCDFKISRIVTSAIHASTVILFYIMSNYFSNLWLLYEISRGYYIIDTLYELIALRRVPSIKLYHLGLILHHVVTIFGLNYLLNPLTSYYFYRTYFLAEVSNFPLYAIRFFNYKGYNNKYIINSTILIEFIGYLYLRMMLCGPVVYSVLFDTLPYGFKFMTITMYIISGMWTYKLGKQCYNMVT